MRGGGCLTEEVIGGTAESQWNGVSSLGETDGHNRMARIKYQCLQESPMIRQNSESVADRARKIYEERLKSELEPLHSDEFVAIEPESGDYFLGKTLSEAIGASRARHPSKFAHALRVGHRAAVHFGLQIQ